MSLGYFSDEVVEWLYENYSELAGSILYEFTTCQRPNGTVYGTAGTCRKGTEIEQRRQESITHLNTTLASLRDKRDKSPEESRSRINRLRVSRGRKRKVRVSVVEQRVRTLFEIPWITPR
jgi:hypothetical protein